MKKAIIVLIAIVGSLSIQAQETAFSARENSNKYIWSIVPQYTAESCMRMDIERRLNNGTSIIVAPRFYVKSSDSWEGNNDGKMAGIGGEIFHKLRINSLENSYRGYIAYGVLYNFYDVISSETTWEPSTSMGVPTSEAVVEDKHNGVNKMGPNLAIGLEMEPVERLIIDIYAGVGARYSFVSYGDKTFIDNHTSILDIGFTGILPLAVVKVGVVF